MNRLMEGQWQWVEGTHGLRNTLLDTLTDADLNFTPGGQAMTLGALIREIGEIEHSYVQAYRTLKQDWDYRHPDPSIETSVARLKAWFATLDDEMKAAVSAFSNDDLSKTIERPGGYPMPIPTQSDVYLQALLIFFGKATIYLRAMNKPIPPDIREWIG